MLVRNAKTRNDCMRKSTSNVPNFQRYCWDMLPIRREAVDKESIYDCILVAIQLWPVERLSQIEPGTIEEAEVLADMTYDIHRMLNFIYGEERWLGYRIIGIDCLLPELIAIMCYWWRRRKDNRAKIILWRRKWVTDGD